MTQFEQTESKEQPKQQYTPNQYRNSKDAKKLKEFMKSFSKDADVLARPCIFEQLPMLFLELDEEFNNNPLLSTQFPEQVYERMEALLLFKSDKATNSSADKMILTSDLIQQQFDGKADENIQIAAQSNQQILELHDLIETYAEKFKRITDPILFWFQVLLPKESSAGTSSGIEFLLQVV